MRILDSIHRADISAFTWFTNHSHKNAIVSVARIVSTSADGPLYVLAGGLLIVKQQWEIVQLMALGLAIERTLYFIFKGMFKRSRPPEAIPGFKSIVEPSDRFSFPSGHTSAAFLVAFILWYFMPLVCIILLPWAATVGAARVVLGVHFPSDVFAGALMGYLVFSTALQLFY